MNELDTILQDNNLKYVLHINSKAWIAIKPMPLVLSTLCPKKYNISIWRVAVE